METKLTGVAACPCYNCKDRIVGCHSNCKKYEKYRQKCKHIKNEKDDMNFKQRHNASKNNRKRTGGMKSNV